MCRIIICIQYSWLSNRTGAEVQVCSLLHPCYPCPGSSLIFVLYDTKVVFLTRFKISLLDKTFSIESFLRVYKRWTVFLSYYSLLSYPKIFLLLIFTTTEYAFESKHISKDMTSLHCIQFPIVKPLFKKPLVLPQICNGWKSLFKILKDITVHMPAEDGFKNLFGDQSLNFYLYIGHIVWFMN